MAGPSPTLAPQERRNLAASQDYLQCTSLPEVWAIAARKFANTIAVCDAHRDPEVRMTYGELHQQMQRFRSEERRVGKEC